MNLAAIQTFLTVTRARNLNRAAEELNVTQSAVTARLDALEGALGAKLLNRSRRGATLTKQGYAFLEQAETIMRSWNTACTRTSLPRGVTRLFSFVCDPGLWDGLGEEWIADIRRDYAETATEVWSGSTEDARRWLQSGMSDTAFLTEPLAGPDFDSREFATDQLVQVATRPRAAMHWDPDYVFVDYGPAFRTWHAEAWPGDDSAAIAFSSPRWALRHLMIHGGSAYLPKRMVENEISTAQLYPVEGPAGYRRRVFLSWRKAVEHTFPWLPG